MFDEIAESATSGIQSCSSSDVTATGDTADERMAMEVEKRMGERLIELVQRQEKINAQMDEMLTAITAIKDRLQGSGGATAMVDVKSNRESLVEEDDPIVQLRSLKQVSHVRSYIEAFATLNSKAGIQEDQALSLFLSGLVDEIRVPVCLFKPKTLDEAYALSKLQELTLTGVFWCDREESNFRRKEKLDMNAKVEGLNYEFDESKEFTDMMEADKKVFEGVSSASDEGGDGLVGFGNSLNFFLHCDVDVKAGEGLNHDKVQGTELGQYVVAFSDYKTCSQAKKLQGTERLANARRNTPLRELAATLSVTRDLKRLLLQIPKPKVKMRFRKTAMVNLFSNITLLRSIVCEGVLIAHNELEDLIMSVQEDIAISGKEYGNFWRFLLQFDVDTKGEGSTDNEETYGASSGASGAEQILLTSAFSNNTYQSLTWLPVRFPKHMVKIKLRAQHNEAIGGEGHVQWASSKARKNRIHVIVLEELDCLFVGIYDGFNRSDPPKLLMFYLYKAMYNELEGLFGNTEYAALVIRNSHPYDVNGYDRQEIKVREGEDKSKPVSSLIEVSDCSRADLIVCSNNIPIVAIGENEFSEKLVVISPIDTNSNQQKRRKLWGLVVCHHFSSKFVPYLLRHVCEVLIQIFGFHMTKEVKLAAQMRDIVGWLLELYGGSNDLSKGSLMEAGYSHATVLGDAACETAVVKITSTNLLFWFLSHTAKEIKWGGAKHELAEKYDGRTMYSRSSFQAFLEVVKRMSLLPWRDVEMDAILSLLLILSGSLLDDVAGDSNMIVNFPTVESILYRSSEVLDDIATIGLLEKENDGISFADIAADEAREVEESLDGDYDASMIEKIFEEERGELKDIRHGKRDSGKAYGNRGGRSWDQGGLVEKGARMEGRGFVVTDDGGRDEKPATSVLTEWVTVPLAGRMKVRKLNDTGWLVSIWFPKPTVKMKHERLGFVIPCGQGILWGMDCYDHILRKERSATSANISGQVEQLYLTREKTGERERKVGYKYEKRTTTRGHENCMCVCVSTWARILDP